MPGARIIGLFALLAATPVEASDLVYMARLDSTGAVVEEHSLRCEPSSRCMLVFDEASENWRQALSIEVSTDADGLKLVGRSAGTDATPLLIGSGRLPFGKEGGVATVTLKSETPGAPRFRIGGDISAAGFGPFIVGLQPVQR